MAFQLAKLILEGSVTDVQELKGTSARTGNDYHMAHVFLVSPRAAFQVAIDLELLGKIERGDVVVFEVSASAFRDEVQYRLTNILDICDESGTVKADLIAAAPALAAV